MLIRNIFTAVLPALMLAGPPLACAQSYPSRSITVIVPFPPGASSDTLMRIVGQKFSESAGQQLVIENRPGGGGATGAVVAKQATPDGYVLMQINLGSHAANTVLADKLPYDPVKDFLPITLLWVFPSVLTVPAASPARSVAELVALAKNKPGGISYASQGVGSGGHILGAMLKSTTGAPMIHIPYKGSAQAIIDVVGGRVDLLFAAYASVISQAKEGRVRLLATTASSRLAALPDLPTMAEAGFRGVDLDTWFGMAAPAGTPDAVIQKLHAELVKAVRNPQVVAKMAELGIQPLTSSPPEFAAMIQTDIARLGKLVKELGAKGD